MYNTRKGNNNNNNNNKRNKTQKNKNHESIQHHHLLVRLETKHCPAATDKQEAVELIERIIKDIKMHLLGAPRVFYVTLPHYNEGLTALAPIETSHIAFHFWKTPERKILKNKESNCLLEFDLYTCGNLNSQQISRILHHLSAYKPTHANISLLNRKYSLTLERQLLWGAAVNKMSWAQWVDNIKRQ